MNLLIVTSVYYPDVIGGGEYSTKLMAEGLVSRKHSVDVFCLGMKDVKEVINGVNIIRKYIPYISEEYMSKTKNHHDQKGISSFRKILKKHSDLFYDRKWYTFYSKLITSKKYDVVHSTSALSYMGRHNFWKAAYNHKIPVSHVTRSPDLLEFKFLNGKLDNLYRKLNSKDSKYLTALAAPSKYMLDCHINAGIFAKYSKVIYNAIDNLPVSPSIESIDKKKDMIVYAGDIRNEKGVLTLYKAYRKLEKKSKLVYIGNGALYKLLSSYSDVKTIDWLPKSELYSIMRQAKVIVLPSEWKEAFGRVLIEAIENGSLAVGSDRGGIPEVLNHDKRYVFESKNIEQLTEKLQRILELDDVSYFQEIVSQQKLLNKYSPQKYIDSWEQFFTTQLSKKEG